MLALIALLVAGLPGQPGQSVLPDSQNMVAVSRWDRGAAQTVAIAGGVTYVGSGTSVLVISDSVPVFTAPIGGQCEDLLVYGGNLYAVAGKAGLVVLDLGDPERPRPVGGLDLAGYALRFAKSGSLGAVASADYGVTLLDLSDPARPERISNFTPAESAIAVAIVDSVVYVACGARGLVAVDVGSPKAPRVTALLKTPAPAVGLAVRDSVVFVMCGDSGALVLNTRQQPPRPTRVNWTGATAMDVSGDLAAVACGWYGVLLEDVSDPTRPQFISSVSPPGFAWDVAVGQGLLGVAGLLSGVLRYDVSTPASPVFLSRSGVPGYTRCIAAADSVAWVGTTDGLHAVDIGQDSARGLGLCSLSRATTDVGLGQDFAAVALGDLGVGIVTTSDPQNPSLAATLALPDSVLSVAVLDSWVFVGTRGSGLIVVKVADRRPALAGVLPLAGPLVGLSLRGSILAVAAGDSGLYIVDANDPTALRTTAHVSLPGRTNAAAPGAGYVAACGSAGLFIVDTRGLPRAPVIGSAGLVAEGWDVAVADTLCYVATDWAGVLCYNVSDRSLPWPCAWYAGGTLAQSVALAGADALMGDLYSGVTRLRLDVESAVAEPAVRAEPSVIVPSVSLPSGVVAWVRPSAAPARVSLFDQSGRKVAWADADASAAWRAVTFPAFPLGAGVFFVRVEQAGRVETRRTCLLR